MIRSYSFQNSRAFSNGLRHVRNYRAEKTLGTLACSAIYDSFSWNASLRRFGWKHLGLHPHPHPHTHWRWWQNMEHGLGLVNEFFFTECVKHENKNMPNIALWPSASKFTDCGRDEVEASNCEFWSASTKSDLVCSCSNENWKSNCAPQRRIIWRAMTLFKFISLRRQKLWSRDLEYKNYPVYGLSP